MINRLPSISDKHKICIICEGNEEYKYLARLIELDVWNNIYEVSLVNAEGNGNIPARYQDKYQNGSYEVILVFCDTEKKPCEQYEDIKEKINDFHGVDTAAAEVVIFANPCSMQIISKHWTDEIIKTPAKKLNAALIEKHTGVVDYKAKEKQIEEVMKHIDTKNYEDMRHRISKMESDDSIIGNSNFARLLDYLESNDCGWIQEINAELESENC